jgi:hypothetical protein
MDIYCNSPEGCSLESAPPKGRNVGFQVGDLAPDFTLPEALTNQPVSLSSFRGTKTIVFVWASW